MKYVFFDLETSDKIFASQILTYSFIVTNEDFEIESVLSDKIKISALQLPRVAAIMTNRIDVIKHQEEATDNERDAMLKIKEFLDLQMQRNDIVLVGFNSSRFDVPFLRTSMIRNGVNPYSRSMKYLDVLHVATALALKDISFYDSLNDKTTLRLENLLQSFNIIDGSQSHDAEDDVRNLIKLTKHINDNFLKIEKFKQYEPSRKEKLVTRIYFDYEKNVVKDYYVLLEDGKTTCLWINLRRYAAQQEKTKACIDWFNKNAGPQPFILADEHNLTEAEIKLAQEAVDTLSHVTLENFFGEKNCDIEQFIYSMKFDENEALERAIMQENINIVRSCATKYPAILYVRYLINQNPNKYDNLLALYADYRYSGKMKIAKNDFDTQYTDEIDDVKREKVFHATIENMLIELYSYELKNEEDSILMASLIDFYKNSPVMKSLWNNNVEKLTMERL